MLAVRSPAETYRKVDFDARVSGAEPQQLVALCYEHLVSSLASAVFAHEHNDNRAKSQALTRALSALTALQLGVDASAPLAPALHQLYESARRSVLNSVLAFDPRTIGTIRDDFAEIARAMRQS